MVCFNTNKMTEQEEQEWLEENEKMFQFHAQRRLIAQLQKQEKNIQKAVRKDKKTYKEIVDTTYNILDDTKYGPPKETPFKNGPYLNMPSCRLLTEHEIKNLRFGN